jgi:hypothetical protein
MSGRLIVDRLGREHVHEISMTGVRNTAGSPRLHAEACHTLNMVPQK